jgi:hypothetical protein
MEANHVHYWQRPHTANEGLASAVAEEKLNLLSGISWPLHNGRPLLVKIVTRIQAISVRCGHDGHLNLSVCFSKGDAENGVAGGGNRHTPDAEKFVVSCR